QPVDLGAARVQLLPLPAAFGDERLALRLEAADLLVAPGVLAPEEVARSFEVCLLLLEAGDDLGPPAALLLEGARALLDRLDAFGKDPRGAGHERLRESRQGALVERFVGERRAEEGLEEVVAHDEGPPTPRHSSQQL